MAKKQLRKDVTRKEFLERLSNANSNEELEIFSEIDYKQKLIDSINSDPQCWQDFGKNYVYPFTDNISKALKSIATKPHNKVIEILKKLLSNEDFAEQLLTFKDNFDEAEDWKKYELDYSPYNINYPIKEVLANIDFWGLQKTGLEQLIKLRDILKLNNPIANTILNGFAGMNNKLTSMRYEVIDELILAKRKSIKESKRLVKQIKNLKYEDKEKSNLIDELNKSIADKETELKELESRKSYETACEIVSKNPSKYIDLLVPMYEYIADRWNFKKKNGSVNRSQVTRHIKKLTNHKIQFRTIQTALDRHINKHTY